MLSEQQKQASNSPILSCTVPVEISPAKLLVDMDENKGTGSRFNRNHHAVPAGTGMILAANGTLTWKHGGLTAFLSPRQQSKTPKQQRETGSVSQWGATPLSAEGDI